MRWVICEGEGGVIGRVRCDVTGVGDTADAHRSGIAVVHTLKAAGDGVHEVCTVGDWVNVLKGIAEGDGLSIGDGGDIVVGARSGTRMCGGCAEALSVATAAPS